MSSLNNEKYAMTRSRKALIPTFAVIIFMLLGFISYDLIIGKEINYDVTAITSTLTALTALVIACYSARRDDEIRKEEKTEINKKRNERRREAARLYAEEIKIWSRRKDVLDALVEITHAHAGTLVASATCSMAVYAKEAIERINGPGDTPQKEQAWLEQQELDLKRIFSLPSLRSFSSIPSIWSSQFKTTDVELLGSHAVSYFVAMNTIWENMTYMSKMVPKQEEVIHFFENNTHEHVEDYFRNLSDFFGVYEKVFSKFTEAARTVVRFLEAYDGEDSLNALPVPDEILLESQRASTKIPWLLHSIAAEKSMQKFNNSMKTFKEMFNSTFMQNEQTKERLRRLDDSLKESSTSTDEALGRIDGEGKETENLSKKYSEFIRLARTMEPVR